MTTLAADRGPATGWRATRIFYATPAHRRRLVREALSALDAAECPWFWVDLHRPVEVDDVGAIEVAASPAGGRVPTQWFRDAVGKGLVERASPVEQPSVLDPALFPGGRPPDEYSELLVLSSVAALRHFMAGEGDELTWGAAGAEVAALYEAVVPDRALRNEALIACADWLERSFGWRPDDHVRSPLTTTDAEAASAGLYAEAADRLRTAVDEETLVVCAARLAHLQVGRLAPEAERSFVHEIALVRDLAERTGRRQDAERPVATSPPNTVFDHAAGQLALVCEAVGQPVADVRAFVGRLAAHCGDHPAGDPPRWSCLGDDCSPFEVSLTTSRTGHQVRLLVEAQSSVPSPAAYWEAGCKLTRWLADDKGLDTTWFDEIADLFTPAATGAYWAVWHGFDFGEEPLVKVYLNPRLGSRPSAVVVRDAMVRLGFERGWPAVESAAALAAPSHVSIDLGVEQPRLKVYLRHDQDAARSIRSTRSTADDFVAVCDAVGADAGVLGRRPPFTTLYFTAPHDEVPTRTALHLPVQTYVPDDDTASTRIQALLESFELDPTAYGHAHGALASQSGLDRGLNSYLGFQRDDSGPRVTTYFGARLYTARYGWPARAPGRTW